MAISERDMEHIFERLRSGVVPERGLEMFAVGIEHKRAEIHRLLKMAEDGEGVFKFLRGGMVRQDLAAPGPIGLKRAVSRRASWWSDNDLHFDQFDDVYRKVVQELVPARIRVGLGDILDRWIGRRCRDCRGGG